MPRQITHKLILAIILIILLLPLLATLLYSLATSWSAHILPDGLTLHWYQELFASHRFITALWNSVWICLTALLLTAVLVIPSLFVIYCYFPVLKRLMSLLIILPFAVPPVVSSVGLLELFSSEPLLLTGTPWILLGAFSPWPCRLCTGQ